MREHTVVTTSEWALEQPCVTRCCDCDWTHEGSALEGREAHLEHRTVTHGKSSTHKHRYPSKQRRWVTREPSLDSNIAKVRAQGGAQWTDGETA